MSDEFKGKRVIVTGGTKGIGEAVVTRLASAGATVVAAARNVSPEQASTGLFIAADLGSRDGVARLAQQALERLGGIDIIVHAVGGSTAPPGGFAIADEAVWADALNLNLLSAVRLDRTLVPKMIAEKSGVIIHVSSTQARMPLYDSTLAYAAAKAALTNYSKALSNELGPKGIRVMSIAPGFTETEAAVGMIDRMAKKTGKGYDAAKQDLLNMLGGIPIGRPNKPAEVAELVAFVASDRAPTLTGTEYLIDGGTVASI